MEAVFEEGLKKNPKAKQAKIASRKYKMVIVGEGSVGKSNLVDRIWRHRFAPSTRATVKCDVADIYIETNGALVCFEVWDTAGQEIYRGLSESFYRNAHLCVIVYDVTRRATFVQAQWWYEELLRRAPPATTMMGSSNPPNVILVGNKSDLEHLREVSYDEGAARAAQWNNSYFCEHTSVFSQDLSPFMIEMANAAERTLRSGVKPLQPHLQLASTSLAIPKTKSEFDNIFMDVHAQPQAKPIAPPEGADSDCAC